MGSTAIPAEGSSRTRGNGHRARRCGAPATPTVSAEFPPGAVGATVRAGGKRIWVCPAASWGNGGAGCGALCRRCDLALAGPQWAHLLADGIDELHRFAADLGINRLSYQGPP